MPTGACPECGGDEFKPGRFWHSNECPRRAENRVEAPKPTKGILLSPEDLLEMRRNAQKWKAGDTQGLGDYISENGFLALQVLAAVMTAPGGHRSSNQQRVSSAKAFVAMSAEVVKVMDALESRREKSHRRPAALRAQEESARFVPPSSPQPVPTESEAVSETDHKSLN